MGAAGFHMSSLEIVFHEGQEESGISCVKYIKPPTWIPHEWSDLWQADINQQTSLWKKSTFDWRCWKLFSALLRREKKRGMYTGKKRKGVWIDLLGIYTRDFTLFLKQNLEKIYTLRSALIVSHNSIPLALCFFPNSL